MRTSSQGLKLARLLMVLGSLSPLFLLWSIRGVTNVPDVVLWCVCGTLILLPQAVLFGRIHIAKMRNDQRALVVGTAEDHREHLLVYLFAMLLPLYDVNLGENRQVAAMVVALVFVVLLFWHLNLHYMNIFFAIFGYRVFTIQPPVVGAGGNSGLPFVLLTKRAGFAKGQQIDAYRLSDTVYFEKGSAR